MRRCRIVSPCPKPIPLVYRICKWCFSIQNFTHFSLRLWPGLLLLPTWWSSLYWLLRTLTAWPPLGTGPWYPIPTERIAMGPSLEWAPRLVALWGCRISDTCRMLWHMLGHPFAWSASNIRPRSVYAPMTTIQSDLYKLLRGLLSWHSPLFRGWGTSGTVRRNLSYKERL